MPIEVQQLGITKVDRPVNTSAFGSASSQASGLLSADHLESPYAVYKIRTTYEWENGTVLLPVASSAADGSPIEAAISQLSSPYGFKIVEWEAVRRGQPPKLPDPEPEDDNQVLAKHRITFDSADLAADLATETFRASGFYIYLLKKPISVRNGVFHIGNVPCYNGKGTTKVGAGSFDAGILG